MGETSTYEELEQWVRSLERSCEKLKQTEEELELILNFVPGIICTAGTDGYFKSINPAMEKALGFSREELLARPLFDFIHPEDINPVKTEIDEQIGGRHIRIFQNRYLCKNGSYRLLEWHTTSAVDGILYATARDITEHMLAEQELKRSMEVSKTILNTMNDAVSLINIDDLRIIDVNKTFMEQYGLQKEDIIGKSCHEVTHNQQEPCGSPYETCPLKETLLEKRTAHAEHVHFLPDGSKTFAEIITSPIIDENGKVTQVVHIARDITKRKQADEEREKLIVELQKALEEIKTLHGIIPICMYCKNIKGDKGDWDKIEKYITEHSNADFTHGICPDCLKIQIEKVEKIK